MINSISISGQVEIPEDFWVNITPNYQYHPPNNLLKMTKVRLVRGRKMNLPGGLVMEFWVDDFPFPKVGYVGNPWRENKTN